MKQWSDEEVALLRANRHMTAKRLAKLLPGRTPQGVNSRRIRYGLTRIFGARQFPVTMHVRLPDETELALRRVASRIGLSYHDVVRLCLSRVESLLEEPANADKIVRRDPPT